jgi:ribosomal-protein-alanine N-acetyltransferase
VPVAIYGYNYNENAFVTLGYFVAETSNPTRQTVTHSDLLIRRMAFADIPKLMPIESVSFGRHHWSEDSFRYEIKNQIGRYYSLIDKRYDRLIGYCGYWIIVDEAHITTIAVDHEYRGNGLGELMLVKMLDRMMGQSIHWATLEVRVSNFSAQQLYYKYRFRSMGTRPHYYQDTDEDALIMTTDNILTQEFRDHFRPLKTALKERLGGALPEGAD